MSFKYEGLYEAMCEFASTQKNKMSLRRARKALEQQHFPHFKYRCSSDFYHTVQVHGPPPLSGFDAADMHGLHHLIDLTCDSRYSSYTAARRTLQTRLYTRTGNSTGNHRPLGLHELVQCGQFDLRNQC